MQGKKPDPKPPVPPKQQPDKFVSYKNNVQAVYDKGASRADVQDVLKEVVPDTDILNTLIEFQKKLDQLVKRKRFDLQQLFIRPARKIKKLLRVHVKNEVEGSSHKLKIKGYLFPQKKEAKDIKFTSFFKQVSLRFSNEGYSNFTKVEEASTGWAGERWNRPELQLHGQDISGDSLHTPSQPAQIQDRPLLTEGREDGDCNPHKHTGSHLALCQGKMIATQVHKLQDMENKEIINTDENLKNAFKCEKIPFSSINGRIRELLSPTEPVLLNINISGDKPQEKVFDFIVEVEARPRNDVMPFLSQRIDEKNEKGVENPYYFLHQKIKKIDKAIQQHTEKLRRHVFKREVYKHFNQETIEKIITQQNDLLKVLNDNQKRDNVSRLQYFLENEDEVEKEIKTYLEGLNSSRQNND